MILKNFIIGHGSCEVARFAQQKSQDKDIAFAKASFISIIGKNGSGKSTFLRSINQRDLRFSGSVSIGNTNYDLLSPLEKAKLTSVVLTERNFSLYLKVQEILEISRAPYSSYYGKLSDQDRNTIRDVLDRLQLNSIAQRTLGTLSDGQLQRVLIARSLVQDTPYIFMDEPTSHLDIHYKVDLLVMLKDYCVQHGKTIVYATHELQIALKLSDSIVSIHNGIISQDPVAIFVENELLKEMFPSRNISFNKSSILFNF